MPKPAKKCKLPLCPVHSKMIDAPGSIPDSTTVKPSPP